MDFSLGKVRGESVFLQVFVEMPMMMVICFGECSALIFRLYNFGKSSIYRVNTN